MKVNRNLPYLLILSAVASCIEIELSLPSFPDIAKAFAVSEEVVERTISLNFLGFCLSALFYGPLSDYFGRRPVMLTGTLLFVIGSLGCAMASSIEFILWCRFLQGCGAAASLVIVFTMLSDVYEGSTATTWVGRLNSIETAAMAGAPILGGVLNSYIGWHGCYSFVAILSGLTLMLLVCFLPETRKGREVSCKQIIADFRMLLSSMPFLQTAMVPNLIAGGYMAFVAIIPFLYRDRLGMSSTEFSIHQAIIISSFSLMSYYAAHIARRFGEKSAAIGGLTISAAATVTILLLSLTSHIPAVWLITLLMALTAASCAVSFAVVFSASLALFSDKNGPASSLMMSMRSLICAITVQFAGQFYNGTVFTSAAIVAACYVLALVLAMQYYFQKKLASAQVEI